MAWWKQSTSKPSGTVDMDEEEELIDLTSDTEASAPAAAPAATEGVEVMNTWMLKMAAVCMPVRRRIRLSCFW